MNRPATRLRTGVLQLKNFARRILIATRMKTRNCRYHPFAWALVLSIRATVPGAGSSFNILDYGAHNDGSGQCDGSDSFRHPGGQCRRWWNRLYSAGNLCHRPD
ncbi:MAG: hypothetical protein ACLPRE_09250 [Limisphaerales bacterium]